MWLRRWAYAAGLTALVAFAVPERAEACSGPACQYTPITAPAANLSVPANTPALVLNTAYYSESIDSGVLATMPPDAGFALLYADGGVVPATLEAVLGAWLLRPDAPLEPGARYELSYNQICPSTTTIDANYRVPFVAGENAALPTQVATLSVVAQRFEDRGLTGNGCGNLVGRFVWSKIDIVPAAEMIPWLPVTEFSLYVDGEPWAGAPFGRLMRPAPQGGMASARNMYFVHAQCDDRTYGDPGVAPGTHSLKLVANIAGMDASFESAELVVDLDCDGGVPGPGGPVIIDSGGDAGAASGSGSNGSGCSAAGRGVVLVGLVLLPFLFRRRRE